MLDQNGRTDTGERFAATQKCSPTWCTVTCSASLRQNFRNGFCYHPLRSLRSREGLARPPEDADIMPQIAPLHLEQPHTSNVPLPLEQPHHGNPVMYQQMKSIFIDNTLSPTTKNLYQPKTQKVLGHVHIRSLLFNLQYDAPATAASAPFRPVSLQSTHPLLRLVGMPFNIFISRNSFPRSLSKCVSHSICTSSKASHLSFTCLSEGIHLAARLPPGFIVTSNGNSSILCSSPRGG